MLGALRSKKNNPVIILLLGFVIVLMAGFGVSFSGLESGRWAAKVGGETIPYTEFQKAYQRAFRARQQQDRSYDRNRAEAENLKAQVLDNMIAQRTLAEEARARGLRIDDEALKAEILAIPAFQDDDGRFDPALYERAVRGSGSSPVAFETELREQLLADQMSQIMRAAAPSEEEIRARWQEEQTKLSVRVVEVPASAFEDRVGEVSEDDVDAWERSVEDPEQAVLDFYKRNKAKRYDVPKKVCARHILIKSPKGTPPDTRAEHRERLAEAGKKIASGELSFEEAARAYSEDPSKTKGGDLGCFGPGQMVPAFERAAFALGVGELSDRVESVFGFHLIEVYDVKDPVRKKLEDVRGEIRRELARSAAAKRLARARAEALLAWAADGGLEAAVAAMDPGPTSGTATSTTGTATSTATGSEASGPAAGEDPLRLEVEETGPFARTTSYIPPLGDAEGLVDALWSLSAEEPLVSAPLERDDGWLVAEFADLDQPSEEDYEEARRMLVYRGMLRKQNALYERFLEGLKSSGEVEINPLAVSFDDELQERVFGR